MTSWEKYIQIDRNWVSDQLKSQYVLRNAKLCIRVYTIKFSGTLCSTDALIQVLTLMIKNYVYNPSTIKKLGADAAFLQALKYFGHTDPVKDGKYGELLLFALAESVLGCKMIAHKIRNLTNYKDQVKGGDGIFLGNYETDSLTFPAYFIGESKIMNTRSETFKESLDSLQRFHDLIRSAEFTNNEFMVAKDCLNVDDGVDLEEVYDRLTPTTEKFKQQNLVHPILLMFNTGKISSIETKAATNTEAETLVEEFTKSEKQKVLDYISEGIKEYPEICKVYLDFFLMPVKDVKAFRHAFYYCLHNAPYKK